MASTGTKVKELKFPYAFDKDGNLVAAKDLTLESRLKHEKYYISGPKQGNPTETCIEELIPVVSDVRRNHFRRYSSQKTGYTGDRVIIEAKRYNHSVIYEIAKRVLTSGKIDRVGLPEVSLGSEYGSIKFRNRHSFKIDKVEADVEKDGAFYDVMLTNKNGDTLGIIFCREYKNPNRLANIQLVKSNKQEAIIIDILKFISNQHMLDESIEQDLLKHFESNSSRSWIYSREFIIDEWVAGLVSMPIHRTTHHQEEDGNWYVWAADNLDKLHKCPFKDTLDPNSSINEKRYLTESKCTNCRNLVEYTQDYQGNPVSLICSHSDIPNNRILALVRKLYKPF